MPDTYNIVDAGRRHSPLSYSFYTLSEVVWPVRSFSPGRMRAVGWSAVFAAVALVTAMASASSATADQGYPYADMQVVHTTHTYADLVKRLIQSVKEEPDLNVVSRASATMGAKSLGLTIPGNAVIMVYGPKYAVRMLEASVPAGIEAPLVFYVTEDASGKSTLTYRQPSGVFKPYASAALDTMARELDAAFAAIARRAVSP